MRKIVEMKREVERLNTQPVPAKAADLLSLRGDRGQTPPAVEADSKAGVNTLVPIRYSVD